MGDQIKIDKEQFSSRLSQFYSAWKTDKRSGNNQLFGGANSILILMGRTDEASMFQKNNAMHVRGINLEFWVVKSYWLV